MARRFIEQDEDFEMKCSVISFVKIPVCTNIIWKWIKNNTPQSINGNYHGEIKEKSCILFAKPNGLQRGPKYWLNYCWLTKMRIFHQPSSKFDLNKTIDNNVYLFYLIDR